MEIEHYDLKIGDTVILKSGSVTMTVALAEDDKNITCVWYSDVTGEFSKYNFHAGMLMKVDNPYPDGDETQDTQNADA